MASTFDWLTMDGVERKMRRAHRRDTAHVVDVCKNLIDEASLGQRRAIAHHALSLCTPDDTAGTLRLILTNMERGHIIDLLSSELGDEMRKEIIGRWA